MKLKDFWFLIFLVITNPFYKWTELQDELNLKHNGKKL